VALPIAAPGSEFCTTATRTEGASSGVILYDADSIEATV
jgi:hypothetical protein